MIPPPFAFPGGALPFPFAEPIFSFHTLPIHTHMNTYLTLSSPGVPPPPFPIPGGGLIPRKSRRPQFISPPKTSKLSTNHISLTAPAAGARPPFPPFPPGPNGAAGIPPPLPGGLPFPPPPPGGLPFPPPGGLPPNFQFPPPLPGGAAGAGFPGGAGAPPPPGGPVPPPGLGGFEGQGGERR